MKEDLGESSKKVKEVFIKMNMKCKNTIPVANDCDEVMIGSCVSGGEGEKERRGEGERGLLDRAFGEWQESQPVWRELLLKVLTNLWEYSINYMYVTFM